MYHSLIDLTSLKEAYSAKVIRPKDWKFDLILLENIVKPGTWNGEWSDTYDKWTDQWKEAAGFQTKPEKSFFMRVRDIAKNFKFIQICKNLDAWKLSSVEGNWQNDNSGWRSYYNPHVTVFKTLGKTIVEVVRTSGTGKFGWTIYPWKIHQQNSQILLNYRKELFRYLS
jgi:hypothetical protein